MSKVHIGNVKGPIGDPGKQGADGKEGKQGPKGQRGSRWTDGGNITGISVEPTVYPTGLLDSLPNDYYLNSETGCVYRCVTGGDDTVAEWVFIGNIRGAMPDVENSFTSKSRKNALSANAGRMLYEKLSAAGVFPKVIKLDYKDTIHAIKLKMENKDTVICFTDINANIGIYTFSKSGNEEITEELIWIGEGIGLTNGVVLEKFTSTDAGILEYELYDGDNNVVQQYKSDIWNAVYELQNDMMESVSISEECEDENATYKTFILQKLLNENRTDVFLVTHAKAIWWNKLQNKTLYDVISENSFIDEKIVSDEEELKNLKKEKIGTLVPDAYLMGQLMKYVYNLPVIRSGTDDPDDSVGKDGDIYIQLESDGE